MFCSFALCKTWFHAAPRMVDSGGSGRVASGYQGAAPKVGEVAYEDSSSASEAGTSSSSAWCAGEQGPYGLCKTCNGPSVARQPRRGPSGSARESSQKLEKALEVMSDVEGPAVDALRAELKKAQGAAAVPALNVQIAQCASFISRSERRLADLEKQRATEEELLLEAKTRLERLRSKAEVRTAPCATTNAEDELARLRAQVVELQVAAQDRESAVAKGDQPVPMCVEDAVHWLKCRQQEMEDAISAGSQLDVARLASVIAEGAVQPHLSVVEDDFRRRALDLLRGTSQWEGARENPTQWRQSRYGMRGLRIGEASHPGPWSSDNVGGCRSEEKFLDQFQRDLMRGTRRRVRRRVVDTDSDSEMPTTVPASGVAMRRVVGGQSQPRTIFVSSDEERQGSEVRSTIPASLENLRAEREPHSRLEDANREAQPTAVDSTRSEDTSHVVDSFPSVAGVAVLAPASESGIVEINIVRDDSDGPAEDTESIHAESDQDGEPLTRVKEVDFSSAETDQEGPRPADESGETVEPEVEVEEPRAPRLRAALQFLDEVDPMSIFRERGSVMKSVPLFLKGPFRNALKFALEEASAQEDVRQVRGWKLLVLLPRMLLHRGPGGGLVPKSKLVERFQLFSRGDWHILLEASAKCDQQAAISRRRSRRRVRDDEERRAARAEMLVSQGELSSARQALEGAQLAPGDLSTLNALRNPVRRLC